ncbi:olfactory receptor 14I1 [Clarias gariepinus]|uniref:olfactory receptor 14I1 n=1 Tax=Clarias gariepinus TaxID=13013 RepID=UPI00234C45CC|nr:olfactory receptor 14I1 [Clarias gariepinus]
MNSSEKEQVDCTNFSSLSRNKTQTAAGWNSEVTSCFFWSLAYNEVLLNISTLTVLMLFTFSLVVNIYLILGLEHSEALSWNPRYVLLKNLIVSDLLLTLTIGLPALRCLLCRETLSFNFRCIAQYFTGALAISNSLLTVTSMALERFLYTCHGIRYLGIMTNMRILCFMILVWSVALTGAGTSTVLVLMGGAKFGHIIAAFVCEPEVVQAQLEHSKYFEAFNKIFVGSVLFLCLLLFLFSYGRMYQEARQVQQPFQQDNARARCTISFYFAIFLLQLFPSTVKLIAMFGKNVDSHIYMLILVLIPPCVNPLAYGIRNKEVRQALGRLCEWGKLKELFCR